MLSVYIEEEEDNDILLSFWPGGNGKVGGKVGKGKVGGGGERNTSVSLLKKVLSCSSQRGCSYLPVMSLDTPTEGNPSGKSEFVTYFPSLLQFVEIQITR